MGRFAVHELRRISFDESSSSNCVGRASSLKDTRIISTPYSKPILYELVHGKVTTSFITTFKEHSGIAT